MQNMTKCSSTCFTRTKIVCTIGPAVSSYEKLLELIDAGMNVARLNFSHGTHEEHLVVINYLKKARKEKNVPLAIMLDTHGPKMRVGKLKGDSLTLKAGEQLTLLKDIPIHPPEIIDVVSVGMRILFDDGYIVSKVVKKTGKEVVIEILNPGVLKSGKGVNIPDAEVPLPAITDGDVEDLKFGCKHDVDIVAGSFIRSAHHILVIKELLAKEGKSDILVIAKIESKQGVENFDSILQAADGIMVARGDLGVEVELALVPILQKMMIRKCVEAGKVVITATQMLESMIVSPRPTRAEVSDVANAIYDSTSCVMLSGETAVGKYPIEAVCQMKQIVQQAESDFPYKTHFETNLQGEGYDISSAVSMAAVATAYSANAMSIFAFTTSGGTARRISRLRPKMPIIALTTSAKTYQQLAINWGVFPVIAKDCKNAKEAFSIASEYAIAKELIGVCGVVVATSGVPFGTAGSTNMMVVEYISAKTSSSRTI